LFLHWLPDQGQRETILKIILKGELLEGSFNIKELSEKTNGYSGSDLMALCQEAARAPIRDHLGDIMNMGEEQKALRELRLQDFIDAKQVVGPTGSSAQSYRMAHAFRQSQQNQPHQQSAAARAPTNVYNFNMFPVAPANNYQPMQ